MDSTACSRKMSHPAAIIEIAVTEQAQYFTLSAFTLLALFTSVHMLGRFDKKINASLIGFFRAEPPTSKELSEGQPLGCLFRHRRTIVQVLNWVAYSVVAGFIITDGFFIDVNVGRDCQYASVTFNDQNYTCFVAHVEFTFSQGYFDGGAQDFDCNLGPPFEGYYCFRRVSASELNFYRAAEVVGIVAALLPPFAFGSQIGAYGLTLVTTAVTVCLQDEKTKRIARKSILVLQFVVLAPIFVMLLMLALSDYVLGHESVTLLAMMYFQSTITALLYLLNKEEDMRAEELGIVNKDEI